ncbi:unnamed protein product [Thelazia callipaeda]|uniref:CNH domain-containing protein n=1 Tax=Thelazia callipaeda TaxID=103827 RepID=A0A0N5CR46_THECL|nr:unnamed protein product [Thelazia callipaeda]
MLQRHSFIDLNIFGCVSNSRKNTMDNTRDEMKDLRSFTGVNTPYRLMAVSPNATKILFKKNNKQLYLFSLDNEMNSNDYSITGMDSSHETDTIFDVAFLNDDTICLVLQNREGKLYITKGVLNLASKLVIICGAITFTQIICKKHHTTTVIYDETGAVLISYPLSFQSKNNNDPPKISLLHLSHFYTGERVRTVIIEPFVKDKKALFCDPFIYQNCVYLFNRFESTLLSVAITGKSRGTAQVRGINPDARFQKPNSRYANRCLLLLGNTVLVYCHQRLDKPEQEPQLWILNMKKMSWRRLHLILNHHYPVVLVNFQKALSTNLAFLHGECGRSKCQEKVHLYQLSTIQDCMNQITTSNRTSLIDRKICEQSKERSSSNVVLHRSTIYSTNNNDTIKKIAPTISGLIDSANITSSIAPSLRYIRKFNRYKSTAEVLSNFM